MIFKRKKKTEQTDELHHEYGLISNCGYIIRAFLRYRKSTVAFLLLGGIAGASMSYIWTVIAKLVIDMITQQRGPPVMTLRRCCGWSQALQRWNSS